MNAKWFLKFGISWIMCDSDKYTRFEFECEDIVNVRELSDIFKVHFKDQEMY